jgi:hypothetical protein
MYFADISDTRDGNAAAIAMNSIEELFEKLVGLERDISSLHESCREFANHVSFTRYT